MKTSFTLIPEKQLVFLLQGKTRQGFEMLYQNYGPVLFAVVLKIVGTQQLAEDVLQDAFIKIWTNLEDYDPGKGSLFTWLLNIARHTAIDKTRSSEYKHTVRIYTAEHYLHKINKSSVIETQVEYIGIKEQVERLKPQYQSIIDLVYFKGYTQIQVAHKLGIPLGTVKTRIKAAVHILRVLIGS